MSLIRSKVEILVNKLNYLEKKTSNQKRKKANSRRGRFFDTRRFKSEGDRTESF